jgi:large subunit ribosomal protein L6
MSRIGKQPVIVPAGVKVSLDPSARAVRIEGPKGKLSMNYRPEVTVKWDEAEKRILCSIPQDQMENRQVRSYWGMTRALIQSMIEGVTKGYTQKLEVIGVGWNAKLQGKKVQLNVGYCDPVEMPVPDNVTVTVENNIITITGPDKQAVGELAADIRSQRPPEPYNGKGIKYSDEVIQRKQGKAFGA